MLLLASLLITNAAALAPPLRTLLSRSAKPKAREEAITLITDMERDERDKFLDMVDTVRTTPSKLARRPLMRYAPVSWPARDLAALDRVLDIGGVPEDDNSKRRAVLSTLRQLANTRGVLRLEREARRQARLAASFDEMLERTPKIGTPSFEIVSEGAFQVRRYEDFSVVRTARQQAVSDDGVKLGEPKMSGAGAFQALAGYIFGKNKREEKMAMTTPVFTRAGQMEFVLPETYWKDLGKAPAPVSNVELTYGEGGLVAAAYYGGYATKDEVSRRQAELVEAINASEDYAVAGETYSAAYNDPFTPQWRRRNEVLVAVEKRV